jgi:hypothetical protein
MLDDEVRCSVWDSCLCQDPLGSQTLMKSNAQLQFEGLDELKLHAYMRGRRSFAKVLAKTTPPMDAPFGDVAGPVARVPRWVRECSEGIMYSQIPAKRDDSFMAKDCQERRIIEERRRETILRS